MATESTVGGGSGTVFDIQRFSIHDGPGIRTTVFFKGCPLRCPWCQNPESLRPRMEVAFYADRCKGVGDCIRECPRGALSPANGRIRRDLCDGCGACVDACPHAALEAVGRLYDVDGLVNEVSRDRPFFESSEGGVTLSGGEPTLQMEFMGAFALHCRDEGISVGLQTCGLFRWEAFEPFLPLFEFIQFDLKIMSSRRHREVVGADNETILSNAMRFVGSAVPTQFRMPVVPGYTDDSANLVEVATFLRGTGMRQLHLLRYHPMGEAKLDRVGFPISALSLPAGARGRESFDKVVAFFQSKGLEVIPWG